MHDDGALGHARAVAGGCPTASTRAYARERSSAPTDGSLGRSEPGPRPGRPNSSLWVTRW